MSGSMFAVSASNEYSASYPAWKAFDDNSSNTYWQSTNTTPPHWIMWYNPDPIKVSNIAITNGGNSSNYSIQDCLVQASNDNANWTTLVTLTGHTVTTTNTAWDVPIPSNKRGFYKYYRLYNCYPQSTNYICIRHIGITATYMYSANESRTPVKGSGMTLGLTDGSLYGAMVQRGGQTAMSNSTASVYGQPVGTTDGAYTVFNTGVGIGVTPDPAYSGLITDLSFLNTFEPYFYIKY